MPDRQRPSFNLGDNLPAGQDISNLVALVADTHISPRSIQNMNNSCQVAADVLQRLMTLDPEPFYTNTPSSGPPNFNDLTTRIRNGKSAVVQMQLPGGGDHCFTIDARPDGQARILHSWQDWHGLQPGHTMPANEMITNLKRITELNWESNREAVSTSFERLFGPQPGRSIPITARTGVRPSAVITYVHTGTPNVGAGNQASEQLWARLFRNVADFQAEYPRVSGTAAGAAVGFVFSISGALATGRGWREAGEQGVKGALGGAAAGVVAKLAGRSLLRENVLSGVAFQAVFTIWDITEWRMHKITFVELRKRTAEGSGAVAGALSGAAVGGAVTSEFGPGAAIGAFIGGFFGAISGAYGGHALDTAIWDAGEDHIMNAHEFFGWHDVNRNTRPKKTPQQWKKAFDDAIKSRSSKISKEDWYKICIGYFMFLLPHMYPNAKMLFEEADRLRKAHEKNPAAVNGIATMLINNPH